ncbi:hypothetical protein LshimejAT787_0112970 [Lyophyllum shimeji]|uniref:C2H2-type domain-containing protein n=1 Tax=Lyophyllum shimeji TaxID=47721 RepID=A0A9P3PFD2_LYOSH|nr:hypothetical protein LshimejAT787_0112970 [Lyophyllum shimeji]
MLMAQHDAAQQGIVWAGLLATSTRETDDVRAASSLAPGQLLQYLMTTPTCLVLAFTRSWTLTLPPASLLLCTERTLAANAARLIDRAAGAMATVKAFSTQSLELRTASAVFDALNGAKRTLTAVWGLTSAQGQFTTRDVRAGLRLIRREIGRGGQRRPGRRHGRVLGVPHRDVEFADLHPRARALLEMARGARTSLLLPRHRHRRRRMTRVQVTFSYPACAAAPSSSSSTSAYASNLNSNLSADAPALCNVSLFPHAAETTFIGGGSRFGKSSSPPSSSGYTPRGTARCTLTSRMIPPVLVLHEATSTLDPASRLLVFAALRAWRRNKTTVVITHDLAQIGPRDFMHVMKHGHVVEQGFRPGLEASPSKHALSSLSLDDGTHSALRSPSDSSYYDPCNKGGLTCQTLFPGCVPGSTSPLGGSPITPSSAPSMSPLSRMLDDFSLDEHSSGRSDELPMGSPSYTDAHTSHSASSGFVSGRNWASEGLHLQIPDDMSSLDELFPSYPSAIDNFDGISLENSFLNPYGLAGTIIDSIQPSDEDFFDTNEYEFWTAILHSSLSPASPQFNSSLCGSSAASLYSTALPSAGDSTVVQQHRRSQSHSTIYSGHVNCGGDSAPLSASLLSPTDNMPDRTTGTLPHRRSHWHSGAATSSASAPSTTLLLSPDYISEGQRTLQRRHSHSNGSTQQRMLEHHEQPVRRSRSTTAGRSRSPYARNRELPKDDLEASGSQSAASGASKPVVHPPPSTRTPELPSASPPQGDMFGAYDPRSGIAYPIRHWDTIASEAVLIASEKRRKKAANYQCTTCNQFLTSKDNLNNHLDAHEGIRRHQCEYCLERFRTRSVLKRHQKSAKCPGSHLVPKPKEN